MYAAAFGGRGEAPSYSSPSPPTENSVWNLNCMLFSRKPSVCTLTLLVSVCPRECPQTLQHQSVSGFVPRSVSVHIFNIVLTVGRPNIIIRGHWLTFSIWREKVSISELTFHMTTSAGYYQHPEVVQFTTAPKDAVVCEGCRLEMNCSIPRQNTVANLPQPELEWIFNGTRLSDSEVRIRYESEVKSDGHHSSCWECNLLRNFVEFDFVLMIYASATHSRGGSLYPPLSAGTHINYYTQLFYLIT